MKKINGKCRLCKDKKRISLKVPTMETFDGIEFEIKKPVQYDCPECISKLTYEPTHIVVNNYEEVEFNFAHTITDANFVVSNNDFLQYIEEKFAYELGKSLVPYAKYRGEYDISYDQYTVYCSIKTKKFTDTSSLNEFKNNFKIGV